MSWLFPSMLPFTNEPFQLARVLALVVLTTIGAIAVLVGRLRGDGLRLKLPPGSAALAVYVVAVVLALALSVHRPTSLLGEYGRFEGAITLVTYVLVLLLALQVVRTPRDLDVLTRAMVAATVLPTAIGLLQYAGVYSGAWDLSEIGRPFSTFGNPDFFGGFLVFAMFVSLAFALTAEYTLWKVAGWVTATASVAMWIGLAVRSAWIAGVFGMVLFGAILVRNRPALTRVDIGFVAGAALAVIAVAARSLTSGSAALNVWTRLLGIANLADSSSASRLLIWRRSLAMIAERPLLGWGVDTFRYAFPKFEGAEHVRLVGYDNLADNAHNHFLNTAATIGLPAAIVLYAFIGYALVRALRGAPAERGSESRLLYGGYVAATLAYLVYLQFNVSTPSSTILMWIALGILLAPHARGVAPPKTWTYATGVLVLSLGVAGAILFGSLMVADAAFLKARLTDSGAVRSAQLARARGVAPLVARYRNESARDRVASFVEMASAIQQSMREGRDASRDIQSARAGFASAEDAIRDAVRFAPLEPTNYPRMANLYNSAALVFQDTSYFEKALDAARRGRDVAPYRPDIITAEAAALINLERPGDAVPLLQEARGIDPRYPDSWLLLARYLGRIGQAEEGVALLNEALTYLPQEPRLIAEIERLRSLEASPTP